MAKRYTLSESDRRKLGAGVRRFASMPRDDSDRRQAEPFAAPREFLVGRADEAISPTTDPLTSGSINSGAVSVYRWNETNSAWEDTGDNVEAYDFRGNSYIYNEWVHLHRLGHAGGVLWVLAKKPPLEYLASIVTGTSVSLTRNTWVAATFDGTGGSGAGPGQVVSVSSNSVYLTDAMKPASGTAALAMVTAEFTFLMSVASTTQFVDLRGRLSGWGAYGGQHVDGGTPITWQNYSALTFRTGDFKRVVTGVAQLQVGTPYTTALTAELFFNEDATSVSGTGYANLQFHAKRIDAD